MKLLKWLELHNTSKDEFARIIGKNTSQVHKYMYEGIKPRDDTMKIIFIETCGVVDANAFYDLSEQFLEEGLDQKKKRLHLPKIDFRY